MWNKRKRYPAWRKTLDRLYDKVMPEHSERLFMDVMNRWWLRWYGFEHQGRIGPWRPDFVSHRRKLVIEIDGNKKVPRDIVKQMEYYDRVEQRDDDLYRYGYSVFHVRFTDVRDHPKETKAMVRRWARSPRKYSHGLARDPRR